MPPEIVFQRNSLGKARGVAGYIGDGAVVSVIIVLPVLAVVTALLWVIGLDEMNSLWGGITVAVLIAIWLIWRDVREFERSLNTVVIVREDELEIRSGDGQLRIRWDDVLGVRLIAEDLDASCTLFLADGREIVLPAEVAPFSAIRPALECTLLPRLTKCLDEELAQHCSLRVREGRLSACKNVFTGIVLLLVSPLALLHGRIRFLKECCRPPVQGWRGRNTDFEVDCQGIRCGRGSSASTWLWSDLDRVRLDEAGVVLYFQGRRTLSVSPFAENYWPFSQWVRRLRPPEATIS